MMTRQIRSGDGWRLGWNPNADTFCGLVAGQHWALELTAAEFKDFCRVAQKLSAEMTAMADLLMDEERLTCDQETETVWLEVEGLPTHYSLRFILLTGRGGEGEWPAGVVPALVDAISHLEGFAVAQSPNAQSLNAQSLNAQSLNVQSPNAI